MPGGTNWGEVGGISAVVSLILAAGAYGGKLMNVALAPRRKRKADKAAAKIAARQAAVEADKSDHELLLDIAAALRTAPPIPPTPFNPNPVQPEPGLIDRAAHLTGLVSQHVEDDEARWAEISTQLDGLRGDISKVAVDAATEVGKQDEERGRVQEADREGLRERGEVRGRLEDRQRELDERTP